MHRLVFCWLIIISLSCPLSSLPIRDFSEMSYQLSGKFFLFFCGQYSSKGQRTRQIFFLTQKGLFVSVLLNCDKKYRFLHDAIGTMGTNTGYVSSWNWDTGCMNHPLLQPSGPEHKLSVLCHAERELAHTASVSKTLRRFGILYWKFPARMSSSLAAL